jgi:hypothetical protein
MSRLHSLAAPLLVGLLAAAVPVAATAATAAPAPVTNPSLSIPGLPSIAGLPGLPGLGLGGTEHENKCALFAFSLGPLYSMGPFGPMGPWGPAGPLHDKPHSECLGGD